MAAARAAWPADAEAGVGGIAPERLVFLDECGVLTGMARLYGRSPRGTRAPGEVPHGPWTRLSVLAPSAGSKARAGRHRAPARHAARAAATSARSRPAACRLRLFHVQPHRRSARPTVQGWTRTPVRSASRSRHSARVRWFASSNNPGSAASTSPVIRGFGPPPSRFAVRRPSTRASRARRWAVERPTANRRAAAPGVAPPPPPPGPARAGMAYPVSSCRPTSGRWRARG